MSAIVELRPDGDPSKTLWTYKDIAARAVMSPVTIRQYMPRWIAEKQFPCPVPYGARPLRWRSDAVLRWFEREELRAQAAAPPQLTLIAGGRA